MDLKQGEEQTEFVKEPEKDSRKYIFQKNSKTQTAIVIIVVVLLLIIAGLVGSGVSLGI